MNLSSRFALRSLPLAICLLSLPLGVQAATTLKETQVVGEAYKEGSAEAGYRPQTTTATGPFGQMSILDLPYSVNVLTADLLENLIVSTPEQIFKLSPVAQIGWPSGVNRGGTASPVLRGFGAYTTTEDGLRGPAYNWAVEDKERVEILTGLTGFLYGPTSVGGVVNYVYKRPTAQPLRQVTVGSYDDLQGFVHADLGGPVDQGGRFGYRLNLVGSAGDTSLKDQSLEKWLATLALDWNAAPDTTFSVIGSYQQRILKGFESYWVQNTDPATGGNYFHYGWVPKPDLRYAQPYTRWDDDVTRLSAALDSELNENIRIRIAYGYTSRHRDSYLNNNNYLAAGADEGIYRTSIWENSAMENPGHSAHAFLDARFNTGPVLHQLTTGYYGHTNLIKYQWAQTTNPTITVSDLNVFDGPPSITRPAWTSAYTNGTWYKRFYDAQNSFVIGDDVKFGSKLSALLGANYVEVIGKTYHFQPPFNKTVDYSKRKLTPSLSLIFKPAETVSTYLTYSESLEQGAIVPESDTIIYTNAGKILPPFVSTEYELGVKANVGGMLLTGALYRINKALQYVVNNDDGTSTYVQDGRQVHEGVELTAIGNISEGLRVYGGISVVDPKVKKQEANPALIGKQPMNVAKRLVKLSSEYDLPFVPGLTMSGGVYHVGRQAADTLNTVFMPSHVTGDFGIRYTRELAFGPVLLLKFNVTNITNEAYWVNNVAVGAPRTVAFSGQVRF